LAYTKSKIDQKNLPQEYEIGGEWRDLINYVYGDLIENIESNNLEGARKILSNFSKEKISLGLSAYGALSENFLTDLENLNHFNKSYLIWKNLTKLPDEFPILPKIGNLHGIQQGAFGCISHTSFRASYFAQRIASLLKHINTKKSEKSILEIGGGYGSIPYFLYKKCEFTNNKYTNIDIPESNLIFSFFLMSALPEKQFLLYGENLEGRDFDISIMPNYCFRNLPDNSYDLVFNSHSLTEMSQSTVKEYIKQIGRVSTKYFLHTNHEGNPDAYGQDFKHVNLNDPDFEPPSSIWSRIYRFPELLTNITLKNKSTTFTFWEYLYEKKCPEYATNKPKNITPPINFQTEK
jgi:hypothetical protein